MTMLKSFSIQGKALKLNSADDVADIVKSLNEGKDEIEEIVFSGNTVGVEAGKAIAEAMKELYLLKRADLSDLFTGRLKTEIPLILDAFAEALEDKTLLAEIDLSDNAFGPAGALPLQRLLINNRNIRRLYLNNNGLGFGGGRLLAEALIKSAEACRNEDGREPLLELICCGRNRLECEGATYLSKAFEHYPQLKVLKMPQNSIRPTGMKTLLESVSVCKELQVFDVQDNTFTEIGCKALVQTLDQWKDHLKELNIGECLLGPSGSMLILDKLTHGFSQMEKLYLSYNEINEKGAMMIPTLLANKSNLILLELNGNLFDEEGPTVDHIKSALRAHGHLDALDELDDMEIPSDEEESDDEKSTKSEDELGGLVDAFDSKLNV